MDNKKLGYTIVALSLLLGVLLGNFVYGVIGNVKSMVSYDDAGNCVHPDNNQCPYQQINRILVPVFFGSGVLLVILSLGIYLIFFEKSQQATLDTLKEIKRKEEGDEKFKILLSGLDSAEQKVMKAVKEQDGISQSTLGMRTDLSKTKLSLVLKQLEGKGLVKKISKGKINHVYLKKAV